MGVPKHCSGRGRRAPVVDAWSCPTATSSPNRWTTDAPVQPLHCASTAPPAKLSNFTFDFTHTGRMYIRTYYGCTDDVHP